MNPVLTQSEQKIHQLLSIRLGEYVPKISLETAVYGVGAERPKTNTIEVFIMRMRKKGYRIDSKKHTGYRLTSLRAVETSITGASAS